MCGSAPPIHRLPKVISRSSREELVRENEIRKELEELKQTPLSNFTIGKSATANDNNGDRKRKINNDKPGSACKAKANKRKYVQHKYVDHANENSEQNDLKILINAYKFNKNTRTAPFPIKLHIMLNDMEKQGLRAVASWFPHGRALAIHQPNFFVEKIMPHYFKQSKMTSFNRQLNLYGFSRITNGNDRGGYYNEYFLRGKPSLIKHLKRQKVKGTKVRPASSPENEPNFYAMPTLPPLPHHIVDGYEFTVPLPPLPTVSNSRLSETLKDAKSIVVFRNSASQAVQQKQEDQKLVKYVAPFELRSLSSYNLINLNQTIRSALRNNHILHHDLSLDGMCAGRCGDQIMKQESLLTYSPDQVQSSQVQINSCNNYSDHILDRIVDELDFSFIEQCVLLNLFQNWDDDEMKY